MLSFALVVLASTPDAGVIDRLDLARTWEAAQLFHPSMMHRESPLDEGFVAAVKALDAAKTPEERRAAVSLILAPLKDPTTRVFTTPEVAPGPLSESTDAGVLTIYGARVPDTADYWGPDAAAKLIGSATRIVVDLRGVRSSNPVMNLAVLPSMAVTLPSVQTMAHAGFDSKHQSMYASRMEQSPGNAFRADPAADKRRFAIVLNPEDPIPDWVIAQRAAGLAVFVSSGELTDDGSLTGTTVTLGDGATARIRSAEYVGNGGLVATDVRVPKDKDPLAFARAALRAGTKPKKRARAATTLEPLRQFDLSPITATLPDREHRMLGALRLWLVARRFWAYPYLRQVDADQTLLALFTKLEGTDTLQAYRDAISEAAATLMPDSHVNTWNMELIGAQTRPPFNVSLVDEQLVVSDRTDKAGHVIKWDVVVDLDGEPLSQRVAERLPFSPGSRLDGRKLRAIDEALTRAPGPHKVTVKHADGKTEVVEVIWDEAEAEKLFEPHGPAPHFKVLADNIGFIDLVNLTPDEVDAAMSAVKDTKALIFDVRGYPQGTAFDIGPRLGAKKLIPGVASMCVPLVRAGTSESDRTCELTLQQLTPWEGPRYTKPVIALIDLEAISHAEHSCLILEAYTKVTFIGSPTRGANGNISRVMLPGELGVTYTGLEVKHADGRQLQTVGIEPQLLVRPTLAGLRAGKDEVLERALSFARFGK